MGLRPVRFRRLPEAPFAGWDLVIGLDEDIFITERSQS